MAAVPFPGFISMTVFTSRVEMSVRECVWTIATHALSNDCFFFYGYHDW
jgi:hypothetical protein